MIDSQPVCRTLRYPLIWGVLLSLTACSWFGDDEKGIFLTPRDDYLEATQHNELVVPDDLQNLEDTDPFPIPATPTSQNPAFYPDKPPLPDAIYANDSRDDVRIQRLGDRSWLVVPEPPTTAWPKLKQFLAENGIVLAFDNPQTGRLNTQWMPIEQISYRDVVRTVVRDAKKTAELNLGQDRFLLRVEQGLRVNTTEIHVRYENDSATLPVQDDIVELTGMHSHIPEAEDDLLNEIGAYVAAKVAQQTISKVALQIGSSQKAELARTEQGYPVLRLYIDYERAWATLGQALENAAVDVTTSNRDDGVFQVIISPEVFGDNNRKGFFCRITFSCGKRGKDLDLQVVIHGEGEEFSVSVLEADGGDPAATELSQQVLVLIREFVS